MSPRRRRPPTRRTLFLRSPNSSSKSEPIAPNSLPSSEPNAPTSSRSFKPSEHEQTRQLELVQWLQQLALQQPNAAASIKSAVEILRRTSKRGDPSTGEK